MSRREEIYNTSKRSGTEMSKLVAFSLDEPRYALHLSAVERVVRAVETMPLPKAPEIVLGVINMQGQIIPVVDVRQRFRLRAREMNLKEFLEIIEFRLASETYGIESAFVREVYPLKDFTPLPGAPPFVLGIINVRGQILSVVDLKKFFNLPQKGLGELNKVIIIRNEQLEFGILADVMLGTRPISLETILPQNTSFENMEVEHDFPTIGCRKMLLNACRIAGKTGETQLILLAIEDVTDRGSS